MVSIKDIARAAHVSHSTVSRALRNSPLVNPETSAIIRKIADEQGYTVSAVARSLVTRRTSTIGVVVTSIANPFVGEIVNGIEEVALAHDYWTDGVLDWILQTVGVDKYSVQVCPTDKCRRFQVDMNILQRQLESVGLLP